MAPIWGLLHVSNLVHHDLQSVVLTSTCYAYNIHLTAGQAASQQVMLRALLTVYDIINVTKIIFFYIYINENNNYHNITYIILQYVRIVNENICRALFDKM